MIGRNVDRSPEVRLNEEVRGQALARAKRAIRAGEVVYVDDIGGVERFELGDEDPNAAHVTLMARAGGWDVAFDGQYNAARVAEHLAAADEFLVLAEVALERQLPRAFAENAFAAAELLAKAELLPLPDEVLLRAKTHKTIASRLHEWAELGNIDARFARLLTDLERLRAAARYLRAPFSPEAGSAQAQLALLRDMRAHIAATAPSRDLHAPPRSGR